MSEKATKRSVLITECNNGKQTESSLVISFSTDGGKTTGNKSLAGNQNLCCKYWATAYN